MVNYFASKSFVILNNKEKKGDKIKTLRVLMWKTFIEYKLDDWKNIKEYVTLATIWVIQIDFFHE
jgi:hypothetical protein